MLSCPCLFSGGVLVRKTCLVRRDVTQGYSTVMFSYLDLKIFVMRVKSLWISIGSSFRSSFWGSRTYFSSPSIHALIPGKIQLTIKEHLPNKGFKGIYDTDGICSTSFTYLSVVISKNNLAFQTFLFYV